MNTKEFILNTIKENRDLAEKNKKEELNANINLYNELTRGLSEDYFPDGVYFSDGVYLQSDGTFYNIEN